MALVRGVDPPLNMGHVQSTDGKVTNALGLNQGISKASGYLASDVVHQNMEAQVNLTMDNSTCGKKIEQVKFILHRQIVAYGKTKDGDLKEFKDV